MSAFNAILCPLMSCPIGMHDDGSQGNLDMQMSCASGFLSTAFKIWGIFKYHLLSAFENLLLLIFGKSYKLGMDEGPTPKIDQSMMKIIPRISLKK